MKDDFGGQIMKEFVGLKAKTYSYLKSNNHEEKNPKSTGKCAIKNYIQYVRKKKLNVLI